MKNSICLFLFALILLQGCKKDDVQVPTCESCNFTCLDTNEDNVITNDCISNWECTFKVFPRSEVQLSESGGYAAGDKNVFQMVNSTEGSLDIADDELTDIIVLELDETQTSFSVEDSELEDMKVHYKRVCYCLDVKFKAATTGCIQGEKQADGTWFIQGHLKELDSSEDIDIKFDAQFVN